MLRGSTAAVPLPVFLFRKRRKKLFDTRLKDACFDGDTPLAENTGADRESDHIGSTLNMLRVVFLRVQITS